MGLDTRKPDFVPSEQQMRSRALAYMQSAFVFRYRQICSMKNDMPASLPRRQVFSYRGPITQTNLFQFHRHLQQNYLCLSSKAGMHHDRP